MKTVDVSVISSPTSFLFYMILNRLNEFPLIGQTLGVVVTIGYSRLTTRFSSAAIDALFPAEEAHGELDAD